MNTLLWKLFEKDGKECKESLHCPNDLLVRDFEGEIVFRLNNIYLGRNKRCKVIRSIITVVEKVLVSELIEFQSVFENILFGNIHLHLRKDVNV